MKTAKVLFTAFVCTIFIGAFAQQVNRSEICQSIPGLTSDQQQKINTLAITHQKKMDELRVRFHSESNAQEAANLKTQMNIEMQNHYNNITVLLTPEQQTWYDQACNANGNINYYARAGYGQGSGRGQGIGRRAGPGQGAGYRASYDRGTGYGAAYRKGAGYGRGAGYGAGYGAGRGRRRCF